MPGLLRNQTDSWKKRRMVSLIRQYLQKMIMNVNEVSIWDIGEMEQSYKDTIIIT